MVMHCCQRRDMVWAMVVGMLVYTLVYTTSDKKKPVRSIDDGLHLSGVLHEINTSQPVDLRNLETNIAKIARSVYFAKRHVRGLKTSVFLQTALGLMDTLLSDLKLDKGAIYGRETIISKNVCPEQYKRSTYKGFEPTNCTHGKPLSRLVTVIKTFPENTSEFAMRRFVDSVHETYQGVKTVLGIRGLVSPNVSHSTHFSLTVIKTFSAHVSDGTIIGKLLANVSTPYILIARHAEILTNDSRLHRLIHELEIMQLVVVAGASRQPNGHWSRGCYQSAHRNFTLKYMEGYDESLHECIFCDYVSTPFVVTKESLQTYKLGEFDASAGLFEEWFLRLRKHNVEVTVCPDSMFHVEAIDTEQGNYGKLMSHLNLYRLQTIEGKVITETCNNSPTHFPSSRALSPCMLKANADLVNTVMNVCEEENIICELVGGTALGAVKLGKVLPWERDADITFLSANYTSFKALNQFFSTNGVKFVDVGFKWCCFEKEKPAGTIDISRRYMMDSERLLREGVKPTKVLFDGNWVNTYRNPGLYARNRYGPEMYLHSLHWSVTRMKTSWHPYITNTFMKCDHSGSNDCLDSFNADGDLPFFEFLP